MFFLVGGGISFASYACPSVGYDVFACAGGVLQRGRRIMVVSKVKEKKYIVLAPTVFFLPCCMLRVLCRTSSRSDIPS